jgi:hypothetical protein
MNCLVCKTPIPFPINQFGDTRHPVCQSCWLSDMAWVQGDDELIFELEHGATLQEAAKLVNDKHVAELSQMLMELE